MECIKSFNLMEYIKFLDLIGPSGLIILASIVILYFYARSMKKVNLNLRTMMVTSIFVAIAFILYTIQFIKYPQGGGIQLFHMLPILLLGLLYGKSIGMTGGIILGLLKILNGATIIHPGQFLLDYILSTMMLGLSGVFGDDKKYKVALGSIFAVALSVSVNILSGAVYFGEYANGMNVWWYSALYNISSAGFEGLLCCILLLLIPLETLKKALKNIMGD